VKVAPDSSAVRTALWRALHVEVDAPPHLIEDEIGLAIAAPDDGWRDRPDMHPVGTGPYRAAIVARTRLVEDLVIDGGIGQYVLLGAGLDTFGQRHPEHFNGPRRRKSQPGKHADGSGLPCPVRTKESEETTLWNRKREPVHRDKIAIALAQIVYGERRRRGQLNFHATCLRLKSALRGRPSA